MKQNIIPIQDIIYQHYQYGFQYYTAEVENRIFYRKDFLGGVTLHGIKNNRPTSQLDDL